MLKLINVLEQTVDNNIDEVMEQEGCCMCERCRLDARALVLNQLPPRYVVTEAGMAFEECKQAAIQNRISLYQVMLDAAHKIKAKPHHEEASKPLTYY